VASTALLLKENYYSIGVFKEKSFVQNYVSDSLHVTSAVITYSHCRQQTHSEICSVNETWMSSWCQKLTLMLRKLCALYKNKMVFYLRLKSSAMIYKYIKASTKRFWLSSFLVSCFYKLPVVIQEVLMNEILII